MKNLMVLNWQPHGRVRRKELETMVVAQVENSLALGWQPDDMYLVTNVTLSSSIHVIEAPLNGGCLTGSKMFALEHLYANGTISENEVWWAHDLDAWQNHWFGPPEFADLGLAEYSQPRFNGGSLFLRHSGIDMVLAVTEHIRNHSLQKEEPALNRILRAQEFSKRVTVLNSTYNVGCSAYDIRYSRSTKPILVSHFHPTNRLAWKTHATAENRAGHPSVSARLKQLLEKHFRSAAKSQ